MKIEAICSRCGHVAGDHTATLDAQGVIVTCRQTSCDCWYLQ